MMKLSCAFVAVEWRLEPEPMIMAVESPNRSCDDDSRELGSEPLFLAHPSTHPLSLEWDLEWWPFCREKMPLPKSSNEGQNHVNKTFCLVKMTFHPIPSLVSWLLACSASGQPTWIAIIEIAPQG
ncbi:hypothetical protein HZ326_18785 [Fusarium oxysporum f. sp. albedinis]|nr:hypothetical protein HZ326_18785 [Fusarium oxysporum f. sp. albedinis]